MSKLQQDDKLTIIGAGLVGSLLSIYLAKKGIEVDVYERRPDMRKIEISAGRSINLALSARGLNGLQGVGLVEKVLKQVISMKGRMIHPIKGENSFQPYGRVEVDAINSVSRGELNSLLLDEAEKAGVNIHFNEQCIDYSIHKSNLTLKNTQTNHESIENVSPVIGTDGSGSPIRWSMIKNGRFNYSQNYLGHGYKELIIPPGPNGEHLLDKNALHIWPRKSFMLIALANMDGSFTCTLFFPFSGEVGFDKLTNENKVQLFFNEQFPDAVELMPTLQQDFFNNPTGNLATIRCSPWYYRNKVLILGDAAHAIVPFYGQGMNCGFEDCIIFNENLSKFGSDWSKVFSSVSEQRIENTNAIADLSLANYVEMRDSVTNKLFQLKKQAEQLLSKEYPGEFLSTYSRISFNVEPYVEALAKGKIQDEILLQACKQIKDITELDTNKVMTSIQEAYIK